MFCKQKVAVLQKDIVNKNNLITEGVIEVLIQQFPSVELKSSRIDSLFKMYNL